MAYVNLKHMPKPATEYVVNFRELNGGLNLSELEHRLTSKESPAMRNLIWREGVLCSRDGQEWVTDVATLGVGYTMYERLFHDRLFAHIGTKIYSLKPSANSPAFAEVYSGVPAVRGTFFHYYDCLYYKTSGAYIRIAYNAQGDSFTAATVVGYTPVTVINAAPSTGSGDLYQPENRIQSKKTVKYNAVSGVTEYHLPVAAVDAVGPVVVDGVTLTVGADYSVDLTNGVVTFVTAPPVTTPATNNTVEITYSKENAAAYNSVMDCPYASTYGGAGDLCVVMGGCPAQPNAFFWNGNNVAMDATYFPISQYQLAGDTDDPIMGFGKQQSFLVVFKKHSIGRAKMDTTEVDGRLTVDMPYVAINDKIGCDLPWSIQLIDNNLVWCNTDQGVHVLKDSSYAYENNIESFSKKINQSAASSLSFLRDVRAGSVVCSFDDEKHYWVCTKDRAWVWDYENSTYREPSWYFFTNVSPVAFASEAGQVWHLNAKGQLTKLTRFFRDYDAPIDKSFRFAVQYFGGHDRLKNVNSVIITLRPDTGSLCALTYITDYETRKDRTDLDHLVWLLVPRDLRFRRLSGVGFGAVFRRRPMCRRVRYFTMQLDNSVLDQDLAIVSAQVFYTYQGRLR